MKVTAVSVVDGSLALELSDATAIVSKPGPRGGSGPSISFNAAEIKSLRNMLDFAEQHLNAAKTGALQIAPAK